MESTIRSPVVTSPLADVQNPAPAWRTPRLECFGPMRALTAGGSAQSYSEFLDCKNQAIFLRC